jgi:REP element-mobilizing transposase RayT
MGTYTKLTYQIVFQTKFFERTLTKPNREKLFTYISGMLMKKNCYVYQVGGIENHVHIILYIPPIHSISLLVKDIKLACNSFIKSKKLFRYFRGWNEGFGAFSYSPEARKSLIDYVINQEEHHKNETPREEYLRILKEFEVEFLEKYI